MQVSPDRTVRLVNGTSRGPSHESPTAGFWLEIHRLAEVGEQDLPPYGSTRSRPATHRHLVRGADQRVWQNLSFARSGPRGAAGHSCLDGHLLLPLGRGGLEGYAL